MLAYLVTQRRQEIGIRMALGAGSAVVGLVLERTMALTGIGIVLGLAGPVGMSQWMRSLMFGAGPTDVLPFRSSAALVAVVSLLASCAPARRATRGSLTALRSE